MKTFGRLKHVKGKWHLTAEPHVMVRAKRIFPRVSQYLGRLEITDTAEVCRDIEWLLTRFPLAMTRRTRERLTTGAAEHRAHGERVHQILLAESSSRTFPLALPLRDYQKVAAELVYQTKGLLLADDMGVGKQHAIDTKVLTPKGYVRIGDLRVGDHVIGSDGRATLVRGVFPQGVKPSYRLTFTDGSTVEAGPEHLWKMLYIAGGRRSRERMQPIVVTTEQLRTQATIEQRWPGRADTRLKLSKRLQLFLPLLSAPVEFISTRRLPIPPYTLGQLIANGSLGGHSVALTAHTEDWSEVRAGLEEDGCLVGAVHVYGQATRASIKGVVAKIRELGLRVKSPAKRIPEIYLQALPPERVRLLHGLMDGDGSISKTKSRVSYHTLSEGLAGDVQTLVQCLGGLASIQRIDRRHEGKPVEFRVRLRLPPSIPPCRVKRKLCRYAPISRHYPTRTLRSVEYVRDVESVCIAVGAADSLYCVEHAILTHNTASAIGLLALPGATPAVVATPAGIIPWQWQKEINRFAPDLKTHVIKKGTPYEIGGLKRTPTGPEASYSDVVISTYYRLRGWRYHLAGKFRTIIGDEIQKLINPQSEISKAFDHIAAGTTYRLGLSGTPINNLGAEMYPVMEHLAPGRLGERHEYLREWCGAEDSRGRASLRDPAAFGTYLRTEGMMLRRTRKDVGRELPGLTKVLHHVEWDEDKLKEIERPAAELAQIILSSEALKRDERRDASREFTMILRQATGLAKAIAVADFVKLAVENGERVVLFGWHRSVYDLWEERLKDYAPAWFTGSESESAKRQSHERFMNGSTDVLIMSLRAGAGIDGLQHVCRTVVFGELDWSPSVHEQDTTRVFRDGQEHPVFAYYVLCDAGSDPVIADILGVKRAQLEGIRDPSGAFLENLDIGGDHVKRLAAAYLRKVAA